MYKINVRLSQNLKKTKNSPVYIYYEIGKIQNILSLVVKSRGIII